MNIYEFSERYKISLHKARKIEKDHPAWFASSGENGLAYEIKAWLARGHRLTASQLCALVESPSLILETGKYADEIGAQLSALGNAKREAAPIEIGAQVSFASRNEPDSVGALIDWMKSIIPDHPVQHSYIAVRLLLGIDPKMRNFEIPRIPRAFYHCRNRPDFAAWFFVEKKLTRSTAFYKKPFDL